MRVSSLIILASVFFLVGCKKIKQNTLCKKWQIEQEFVNGQPYQFGDRYKYLEFTKGGKYIVVIDGSNNTDQEIVGNWSFYDSRKYVIRNVPSYIYRSKTYPTQNDTTEILKLKNEKLWLKEDVNNLQIEIHYRPYE